MPMMPPSHYARKKAQQPPQKDTRPTSSERGYTARWKRYRDNYLAHNPLCVKCKADGKVVAATVVDHIIPASLAPDRFWDSTNHQSLCARCHNVKTAKEDGGFGHKRKD